jgi:hypothetical protein
MLSVTCAYKSVTCVFIYNELKYVGWKENRFREHLYITIYLKEENK